MRSHLFAISIGTITTVIGLLGMPTPVRSPIHTAPKAAVTQEPSPIKEPTPATPLKTTFVFGGDIMLDRYVHHTFKDTASGSATAFSKLDPTLFTSKDIRIANLEGPISANPIDDNIAANNLVFNFPPDTPAALQALGVNAVSLANNHSSNKGLAGLTNTRTVLTAASIVPIGQQYGFDEDSIWRAPYGTLPVSIITINTLDEYDTTALTSAITAEKSAGRTVIVFPHWGNEYQTHHSANQEALATEWIAAGAALIIGSHPHVVQDSQSINGVPVLYSMGNFVFDQFFSEETQQGIIVNGTITETAITLTVTPISIKKMTPAVLTGDTSQQLLDRTLNGLGTVTSDTVVIPRPS